MFDEYSQYIDANVEFIPDEEIIQTRFVFFDPTNEKDKYFDFVNLKIESSQETLSGLCKWASL
jgi:hypothetical protein